jgi:ABC-2 type transport system permease protein
MPALQTNAQQTWLEQQTENFLEETPTLDAKSGEALGAYMTAAILTRQNNDREQRIFVMSDADCWSNAELQTQRKGIVSRNFALISTVFRWLSYGEFPVSVTRAQVKDREIKVTPMQLPWCKHIFHIVIPALIAAVGFSILMYRRRG